MASLAAGYHRLTSPSPARELRADMRHSAAAEWARWVTLLVALSWAVGVVVLTAVSFAASRYPEFAYDPGISTWIQHLRGTPLAAVFDFAGNSQTPVPGGIITAIILLVLAVFRYFREIIAAVVSFVGADGTHLALKGLVHRLRPNGATLHNTVGNLGQADYPSGHAAHVLAFYGFLIFLGVLALRTNPGWWRWLIVPLLICAYYILLVGPSRVLEGLHWPSDVLAGDLDGAIWLVVGIVVYHLLARAWVRHTEATTETGGRSPQAVRG